MMLTRDFYTRTDVVTIARDLLGKVLFTNHENRVTAGIITETEAYAGVSDKASHAFGGKRTARTEVMYSIGGTAYIYLCYGMHSLFNVVTHSEGVPHAVLIRGIKPMVGIPIMLERTGKVKMNKGVTDGPGKVSKAMGIHFKDSGRDLLQADRKREGAIWIEDQGILVDPNSIQCGPRIGVDYAGEDALLPYRFLNPW